MPALAFLYCLIRGHRWTHSRTLPGYRTCKRCRRRMPDPNWSDADRDAAGPGDQKR